MNITITIPDAIATQVVDNICVATNYDPASGKTRGAWAKSKVIENIKNLANSGAAKDALLKSRAAIDSAGIS
jgi:hypothetical protein